jgi:hypothetical protein
VANREVKPPGQPYKGKNRVYATSRGERGWRTLCQNKPGPTRTCYIELADRPFPPFPTPRHHRMKGKLKDFWEYEVTGGDRVRYKESPNGKPLIVHAGGHP